MTIKLFVDSSGKSYPCIINSCGPDWRVETICFFYVLIVTRKNSITMTVTTVSTKNYVEKCIKKL